MLRQACRIARSAISLAVAAMLKPSKHQKLLEKNCRITWYDAVSEPLRL